MKEKDYKSEEDGRMKNASIEWSTKNYVCWCIILWVHTAHVLILFFFSFFFSFSLFTMAIAAHEPVPLIWLWIAFLSFATIRWLICFMLFYADSLSLHHSVRFDSAVRHHFVFFLFNSLALSSSPPSLATSLSLLGVLYSLVAVWIVATVKRKTHKLFSGQYNIYIHTHGDEPPHFNLRFTAPDYNNTPTQIKCNNCCLIFFSYSLFVVCSFFAIPFFAAACCAIIHPLRCTHSASSTCKS